MLSTAVKPLMMHFVLLFIGYTNANLRKVIKTPRYNKKCLQQELGYTPDLALPFKFDLKSSDESYVVFYDKDGSACKVLLGGWYNTKSYIKCYSTMAPQHRGKIVNKNIFVKFKIEHTDNAVQVYRHSGIKWIRILRHDNVKTLQPTGICLKTRWSSAQWIINGPEESFAVRKAWKTKLSLANRKVLDKVAWVMEVNNLGKCTLLCNKDDQCMSFNFNPETNVCQGHKKNYYSVAGINTKTERGAIHYYNFET